MSLNPEQTALLLIGYQNDYFAADGTLHGAVEDPDQFHRVLANTLDLIGHLAPTPVTIISTPIVFSPGYRELVDPVGILKTVRDAGAFRAGTTGADTIAELLAYGGRILEVPGKRGLNAFADTDLERELRERGIRQLAVAGVLTSVCVDSTSRHASELGYKVTVLEDCTFGRNAFEQAFYCDKVFPIYATVADHRHFLESLLLEGGDDGTTLSDGETRFLIQQRLFEELSVAERRYRDLVENLRNIVFRYDAEGSITFANRAWRDALGHPLEATVGRPFSDFVRCGPDCSQASLLREPPGGVRELPMRHFDGRTLWFELTLRADDGGGGVGLLYEVTRQHEREHQLREAMIAAQAGTEAKSRFLATMSHEIRTPLNGVLGMADLLTHTLLDHDQKEYVNTIRTSGDSLLTVINGILDYSKIESGSMHLERLPLEPRALVEEVCALLRPRAQSKGIELNTELAPGVPRTVLGDAVRLRQVLTNLLDNALKFTERGSVTLSVHREPGNSLEPRLRLAVQDTGIGIAAEHLDRLFEPFTQADSSTTRKYGGTGLGLAICARLVELMGGEIEVRSEPGIGSLFLFTIPAPLPDEENGTAWERVPAEVDRTLAKRLPLRILVAEDNPVNRDIIQRMLNAMGYRPDLAVDGAAALFQASRHIYDLILMDVQMPRMSGVQAAEQILRTHHGDGAAPVILAVTAAATPEDKVRCLAAGMSDFLLKPVQLRVLQTKLERWGKVSRVL